MYDSTCKFIGKTHHEFEIIRLWEKPSEPLLQVTGLFPFAILSQAEDKESLLRQISQQIEQISDSREQSNIAASTAILAGLVLNKDIIQRLLRTEIMKESVIYQEIKAEGLQEGLQQGRQQGLQQGRQEEAFNLLVRQLNRRLGAISPQLSLKVQSLALEQLENLGEALLDFESLQDLEQWFEDLS